MKVFKARVFQMLAKAFSPATPTMEFIRIFTFQYITWNCFQIYERVATEKLSQILYTDTLCFFLFRPKPQLNLSIPRLLVSRLPRHVSSTRATESKTFAGARHGAAYFTNIHHQISAWANTRRTLERKKILAERKFEEY